MKTKKPFLLIALLAFVLAMALAPAAFAKSDAVAASGSWTWVGNEGGTERELPPGSVFVHVSETGQWTGTFTATDVYEPFVGMFTKSGEVWFHLWIHFKGVDVAMGSKVLHGDMTMLVDFKAATSLEGATWKIHNGTGDLQHLGGAGTLVWTDLGMDYKGTIWTNK